MEKNCLVTTYKATVNDNSLLKVGEMRIKVSSVETPNKNTNGFSLNVNKDVELEIIGDGYFTDETLTQNKGKKITLDMWEKIKKKNSYLCFNSLD